MAQVNGIRRVLGALLVIGAGAAFTVTAGADSAEHWLKDPDKALNGLAGLCEPEALGGSGEVAWFKPCAQAGGSWKPEACAMSNGIDDEGGYRFLVNPAPVQGMNAVLYDQVCMGSSYCGMGISMGRVMLFSSQQSDEIWAISEAADPVQLVPCDQVE